MLFQPLPLPLIFTHGAPRLPPLRLDCGLRPLAEAEPEAKADAEGGEAGSADCGHARLKMDNSYTGFNNRRGWQRSPTS